MRPSVILCNSFDVYGKETVSIIVRIWLRIYNEEHENIDDDERSWRPSSMNDDMVRVVGVRWLKRTADSLWHHSSRILSEKLLIKNYVHAVFRKCLRNKEESNGRILCRLSWQYSGNKGLWVYMSRIATAMRYVRTPKPWIKTIIHEVKTYTLSTIKYSNTFSYQKTVHSILSQKISFFCSLIASKLDSHLKCLVQNV